MTASLAPLLTTLPGRRVLVIGDLMLDHYLWGHIGRISPEAPVPILNLVRCAQTLGGAGNVVKNLHSLGAAASVLSVVGEDETGDAILAELDPLLGPCGHVVRLSGRISSRKTRLMSLEHAQQVFRFDEETADPIPSATEAALIERLHAASGSVDAILCSDYAKGVLTPALVASAISVARRAQIPVVIAPKGHSDLAQYRGATSLVPNARELAALARTTMNGNSWLTAAAAHVLSSLGLRSLLVTRGREGMVLFLPFGRQIRPIDIPTVARGVYDVTGAGDTAVSVFTLALAGGSDHETAARLANCAAGVVVAKRGTATVTPEDLLAVLADDSYAAAAPRARVAAALNR